MAARFSEPETRPLAPIPILGSNAFVVVCLNAPPELPRADIIGPPLTPSEIAFCPIRGLAPPIAVLGAPFNRGAPVPPIKTDFTMRLS